MNAEGAELTHARAEIARLRRVAWDCARLGGADLSGIDGPEHLVFDPEEAVDAVRDLRAGYDEEPCTLACRLIGRVPQRSLEGSVREAAPLDKAKMIAAAALESDLALLKRFEAALPGEEDQ